MGWAESPVRSLDERRIAQRAIGLSLVALLHLLLLAALLQTVIHPVTPKAVREIIFHLMPQARRAPPPPPVPEIRARPRAAAPPVIAPPPVAPPNAVPDLRGLGQNLFGCTPDSMATMTPEARSQCLIGLASRHDGPIGVPREHAKDPQRWANAVKERNAPLGQIPCTYVTALPKINGASVIGGQQVGMVNLNCLHKLLSH